MICSRLLEIGRLLLPQLIPDEIVPLLFSHNVHPMAAEGRLLVAELQQIQHLPQVLKVFLAEEYRHLVKTY